MVVWKNGAALLQLLFEQMGIDQVAVVGHGIGAAPVLHHKGLGIDQGGVAGGGVADMADGAAAPALDFLQAFGIENIVYQPHTLVRVDPVLFPGNGNPCTFLAPVLQGIKAEIGQLGRLGVPVDAEHTTFISGSFVFNHDSCRLGCGIPG